MLVRILTEADNRRKRGDLTSAAALCRQAIVEAPDDPRPHALLGLIAIESLDHVEARRAFAEAIAFAPDNVELLNHYGSTLAHAGDFEAARIQFRRAIDVEPDFAFSYYNLAHISPASDAPDLIANLQRLRGRSDLSSANRSIVCFALGKLYDELGDWDLAFELFREANALRAARYNHRQALAFMAASKATFASAVRGETKPAGNSSDRPVFVIGMPRTGSSLIEDLLARHRDVVGLGERNEIELIAAAIGKHHPSRTGYPNCVGLMTNKDLTEFGDRYLKSISIQAGDALRIVDKQLLNFQYVPFIKMLFPRATIIHAKRDPIDTCLSCYFQNFRKGYHFTFNLVDLGRVFAAYGDLMATWKALLPGTIFDQDYEALVADSDVSVDRLFAAIGLSPPAAAERQKPADRSISTSSQWQVRQPVYASSVGRWRNYERHLGPLFQALDEAGYRYDGLG